MLARPVLISPLLKVLEGLDAQELDTDTYESTESKSASYEMRFMVDRQIDGGGWITCKRWHRQVLLPGQSTGVDAQLVGTAASADVSGVGTESPLDKEQEVQYERLAPLRIMSVDVVCAGSRR